MSLIFKLKSNILAALLLPKLLNSGPSFKYLSEVKKHTAVFNNQNNQLSMDKTLYFLLLVWY